MHYAYDESPRGIIEIVYELTDKQIIFVVKDKGIAFNPLENPVPVDLHSSLEEREIGGLGIHYILKMTDSVTYERRDGWNILTLIINIP